MVKYQYCEIVVRGNGEEILYIIVNKRFIYYNLKRDINVI